MTHRQYLAWAAWFKLDRERPRKLEWHLMQIAAECRKGWVAKPNEIEVNDMRLKFKEQPMTTTQPAASPSKGAWPITDEERSAWGKARFAMSQPVEERRKMIAEERRKREAREAQMKEAQP